MSLCFQSFPDPGIWPSLGFELKTRDFSDFSHFQVLDLGQFCAILTNVTISNPWAQPMGPGPWALTHGPWPMGRDGPGLGARAISGKPLGKTTFRYV